MKKYIKPNTKYTQVESASFMEISVNNTVTTNDQLSKDVVETNEQVWFN